MPRKSLTKQPTQFVAILKSKQAPRPAGFMVGSTLMSKEGSEPTSKKEEMIVAKVKLVMSKYKDVSKESRSSAE